MNIRMRVKLPTLQFRLRITEEISNLDYYSLEKREAEFATEAEFAPKPCHQHPNI